jgi:dihydrofolate synthase/folylpolyglutamate synthase
VPASAARVLAGVWKPIPDAVIVRGIARARWEGRLEPVGRRPLILLDGAHNEAGAAALRDYLDGLKPRRLVLVFTMMKDKAIGRVAGTLFPAADKVIVTTIPFARAASPDDILRGAPRFRDRIVIEPSLRKAIALARADAGPGGVVTITGSLFLVGEAKKL